nr:MAG TPA: hypothetical protein [Caudoviricetes sp.]
MTHSFSLKIFSAVNLHITDASVNISKDFSKS